MFLPLSTRFLRLGLAALAIVLVLPLLAMPPAEAIVPPNNVRIDAPVVLDGRVLAVTQIGSRIVVGGEFTQVEDRATGAIIDQPNLFAYDVDTGLFDANFRPVVDGAVLDILNDPNGTHIYFSGKFKKVDGYNRGRIARYNTTEARLDKRFRGRANAKVVSIDILGDKLIVGGNFRRYHGEERDYLAAIDRRNGKLVPGGYDLEFGESWGGRPRTNLAGETVRAPGVHRVLVRPGTNEVLVSHKHATLNGLDRPALAMLDGQGELMPWATDVYTTDTCVAGWGIAITDVAWAPDGQNFAVSHTGHDTGIVCDTIVKFSVARTDATEIRKPVWSSRVFDSTFALEYGPDAIYIGGHFRFLIHPDAPSPYPGRPGCWPAEPDVCGPYNQADPDRDAGFKADLFDRGYVFPVGQMGAIDPDTGYGIPSWTPSTNAFKGVLTMTLVERGLLIGQDRDRVNQRLVGRAAHFDPTPNAGDLGCRVTRNGSGQPTLTWNPVADSGTRYTVRRNGAWVGATPGTSFTDTKTVGGATQTYSLTYKRYGETRSDIFCGQIVSRQTDSINLTAGASASQSSTVGASTASRAIDGNLGTAASTNDDNPSWIEIDLKQQTAIEAIALFNGSPVDATNVTAFVSVEPFASSSIAQVRAQTGVTEYSKNTLRRYRLLTQNSKGRYVRIYREGGALNLAEVEVLGERLPALTCTARPVDDDTIRITWNDNGSGRYAVVADGRARSVGLATSFTHEVGVVPGAHSYEVRSFTNGARSATTFCATTLPVPEIGCSVSLVNGRPVLQWRDVNWTSVNVGRNGRFLANGNGTQFTDTTDGLTGTVSYDLRVRANGTKYVGQCGSVTLQ